MGSAYLWCCGPWACPASGSVPPAAPVSRRVMVLWFATWKGTFSYDLISIAYHRTFSYEVEMVILYSSGHSFSLERRFVGIGLNVGDVRA